MTRSLTTSTLAFLVFSVLSLSSYATVNAQEAAKAPCAEYKAADKKLNDTYNQILTKRKSDKPFLEKLKKSQRAWLAFRDAELEAIYPAKDKKGEYGSAYTTCRCSDETRLVEDRVKQLEQWINVPEEGEICRGSRQS